MFASNTQPRRRVRDKPVAWFCHKCDRSIKPYHAKCPSCNTSRPEPE